MDGPTIQAASEAALAQGTNLGPDPRPRCGTSTPACPLVVMTYVNLVFHKGYQRFAAEAVAAGVSGVILPDLPARGDGGVGAAAR